MNLIIWIDGVNGVGKSSVAAGMEERLVDKNAEHLDSDQYWAEILQRYNYGLLYGKYPYKNIYFICKLRETLEKKIQDSCLPIVSMSLVDDLCKNQLLEYLEAKSISAIHIILEAKKETILSRIENDPNRNRNEQIEQKNNVCAQMDFLKFGYQNSIRIDTENKTTEDVVNEIMDLL